MIKFNDVTLNDKVWVDKYLQQAKFLGCEYTFGNLFIWNLSNIVKIAEINNYFLAYVERKNPSYLFPAGDGDLINIINLIIEDSKSRGNEFSLHGVTLENKEKLEILFPNKFIFSTNRDYSDYIYNAEDLINLPGKKYHSKRNHISRFSETEYLFEKMTDENILECIVMNDEWCKLYGCFDNKELERERLAVLKAFKYFNELDFDGALIKIDDKVIAFTIGEKGWGNNYVVHVEKAFSNIQGAYPMINREFVRLVCKDYRYINREEDLGNEGLRKAKLSYYPEIILDKYTAKLKEE